MCSGIPLRPPYAFMTYTGTVLPFLGVLARQKDALCGDYVCQSVHDLLSAPKPFVGFHEIRYVGYLQTVVAQV
jgi:hypothetical protein